MATLVTADLDKGWLGVGKAQMGVSLEEQKWRASTDDSCKEFSLACGQGQWHPGSALELGSVLTGCKCNLRLTQQRPGNALPAGRFCCPGLYVSFPYCHCLPLSHPHILHQSSYPPISPASSQLDIATAHHPPFTLQLWSHCFLDCKSPPCCMSSSSLQERSVVR